MFIVIPFPTEERMNEAILFVSMAALRRVTAE